MRSSEWDWIENITKFEQKPTFHREIHTFSIIFFYIFRVCTDHTDHRELNNVLESTLFVDVICLFLCSQWTSVWRQWCTDVKAKLNPLSNWSILCRIQRRHTHKPNGKREEKRNGRLIELALKKFVSPLSQTHAHFLLSLILFLSLSLCLSVSHRNIILIDSRRKNPTLLLYFCAAFNAHAHTTHFVKIKYMWIHTQTQTPEWQKERQKVANGRALRWSAQWNTNKRKINTNKQTKNKVWSAKSATTATAHQATSNESMSYCFPPPPYQDVSNCCCNRPHRPHRYAM